MLIAYPWIIYVCAGVLLTGIIVLAAVLIVWQCRKKKNIVPFDELPEDVAEELPPVPSVPSFAVDTGDYTRVLIQNAEPKLKSYRLSLQQLNEPGELFSIMVKERIVIGRKNNCDIQIPNSTLSGEHCEIILKNGKLYLRDLNSLNGTYLNDSSKRITEELLTDGSIIEIGSERLQAIISVISI